MEYYFQDELRWTFGFANPNKAAALIAAALPFLWILVHLAWTLRRQMAKWSAVVLASAVLYAGWWLLFKTYSRGGIVAAVAAFLYIGWKERSWVNRPRLIAMIAGVMVVLSLFVSTNAIARSVRWVGERDGAVVNRLEVWRGGVEMIAAIPQGVGQGRSGFTYMQWFQPQEATEGYRTLVNSYLTFAVEQGMGIFGVALFGAGLFWRTTRVSLAFGDRRRGVGVGCRASVLAFAVAGFFTTTMEDGRVWIPVLLAGLILALMVWRRDRKEFGMRLCRQAVVAGSLSVGICGAVFVAGMVLAKDAGERVVLRNGEVAVAPKSVKGHRSYSVFLDERVLGEEYGKSIRRLAHRLNSTVTVRNVGAGDARMLPKDEVLIAMGEAVNGRLSGYSGDLILIAPARIEPEAAEGLLREVRSTMLLYPAFDEDGRAAFWKEVAGRMKESRIQQNELRGVGIEVGWAWEQVEEILGGAENRNL